MRHTSNVPFFIFISFQDEKNLTLRLNTDSVIEVKCTILGPGLRVYFDLYAAFFFLFFFSTKTICEKILKQYVAQFAAYKSNVLSNLH